MSVWIEDVTRSQFEVCLRESRTFDGPHSNLAVVILPMIAHSNNVSAIPRHQQLTQEPSSVIASGNFSAVFFVLISFFPPLELDGVQELPVIVAR